MASRCRDAFFLVDRYERQGEPYDEALGHTHQDAEGAGEAWLVRVEITVALRRHRSMYKYSALLFAVATASFLVVVRPRTIAASAALTAAGAIPIAVAAALTVFTYVAPVAYLNFIDRLSHRARRD